MSVCKNQLVNANKPAPQTCPTCFPGECAYGIVHLNISQLQPERLPDALSPQLLIAALRSRHRTIVGEAIVAVNKKLKEFSYMIEDGGVPVSFAMCGNSDAICREVVNHFEAAGWVVSRSSDETQRSGDLDYVFKARD